MVACARASLATSRQAAAIRGTPYGTATGRMGQADALLGTTPGEHHGGSVGAVARVPVPIRPRYGAWFSGGSRRASHVDFGASRST